MQVQIPAWLLQVFFSFIVFFLLTFGFLLFILTADPVSFARVLQKCISTILKFNLDLNKHGVASVL